jgi:hypothetical protein
VLDVVDGQHHALALYPGEAKHKTKLNICVCFFDYLALLYYLIGLFNVWG